MTSTPSNDEDVTVVYVEEDDEWLGVLRVTAETLQDRKVFLSDSRVLATSTLAERLFGDALPVLPPEEDEDDEDTAGRPDAEPVGDPELLADLGTPATSWSSSAPRRARCRATSSPPCASGPAASTSWTSCAAPDLSRRSRPRSYERWMAAALHEAGSRWRPATSRWARWWSTLGGGDRHRSQRPGGAAGPDRPRRGAGAAGRGAAPSARGG